MKNECRRSGISVRPSRRFLQPGDRTECSCPTGRCRSRGRFSCGLGPRVGLASSSSSGGRVPARRRVALVVGSAEPLTAIPADVGQGHVRGGPGVDGPAGR